MSQFQEVEVKLYIPDLEMASARLVAAGAECTVPRVFERNVRYENDLNSLTANGIVVRLRQDLRAKLTYKEPLPQIHDGLSTRFEAEVEVSDFDTMDLILKKLGYQPYMVYEKYRTTYVLDQAEIVLDEMPYGNFVEIEGPADDIRNMIDRLEFGHFPRYTVNYMTLFERVRDYLKITPHDLTFSNFNGINVPADAFRMPNG